MDYPDLHIEQLANLIVEPGFEITDWNLSSGNHPILDDEKWFPCVMEYIRHKSEHGGSYPYPGIPTPPP